MNLQQRLAEIRHAFETGDTPRETVDVLNDNIDRLLAQDAAGKALKIGERAPADLLVQTSGGEQPLSRFFTEKLLVLTWFRGNW